MREIPLSFEQEHLWGQRVPNIPPLALLLKGRLSVPALTDALNQIVARHDALRTKFTLAEGAPNQEILSHLTLVLPLFDLSGLPESQRRGEANRTILREGLRPFDLAVPPLINFGLLRLAGNEHVFFFTIHHIVSDLWSFRVFARELAALYSACVGSQSAPLPALTLQYADYAVRQREKLQAAELQRYLEYWEARLSPLSPPRFPADLAPAAIDSFDGRVVSTEITGDIVALLVSLCRERRCTLFMALIAAFQLLQYRYSGLEDVAVSTLVANRHEPGTEALIGVFANRRVLRTRLAGNPTFSELLSRVREELLAAYPYQNVSFWKLTQLRPGTFGRRNPNNLFAMQDVPVELLPFAGLETLPFQTTGVSMFEGSSVPITGRYDQSWEVWRQRNHLRITVSYRFDLFHESTVRNVLAGYRDIVEAVARAPEARLRDVV